MESCNSLSGKMFNTSLFISYVSRSISQSINHRMIIILRVTSLHDQALKQNKKQTIRSHSSWNSACSLPFEQQRQWRVLMMNASVTTQPTCSPRIHHTRVWLTCLQAHIPVDSLHLPFFFTNQLCFQWSINEITLHIVYKHELDKTEECSLVLWIIILNQLVPVSEALRQSMHRYDLIKVLYLRFLTTEHNYEHVYKTNLSTNVIYQFDLCNIAMSNNIPQDLIS